MKDFSFITNSHPAYIEGLYQDFVKNPDAVDPDFRRFFEGFDFAVTQGKSAAANGSANANGAATATTGPGAATANGTSANGAFAPATPVSTLTTADGVDWKKELGA